MGIPVKLQVFEGPLDLLLHLIDKKKIDIYEELKRLEKCSAENEELLYTIQLITEIMNGLKEKD